MMNHKPGVYSNASNFLLHVLTMLILVLNHCVPYVMENQRLNYCNRNPVEHRLSTFSVKCSFSLSLQTYLDKLNKQEWKDMFKRTEYILDTLWCGTEGKCVGSLCSYSASHTH